VTNGASLDELLDEAESQPVLGWDFTWLGNRISTTSLPWDFEEMVLRLARRSPDLLDMGTGGGERLAAMAYRPLRTVATESWPPNVDRAGSRLRPLGVTVVRSEGAPDNVDQRPGDTRGRLPFPSESFALVSNRHESFVASEVARVLTPGGTFVTQQVGGEYGDFYDALVLPRPNTGGPRWNVDLAVEQVGAAGMRPVDSGEAMELTSFADVGALAWYLQAIPWVVRGFSIQAHHRQLERLHARMQRTGPLVIGQPAFWLEAVKAA
jgi:SAM-dependent methyltransferase